jgi:hypothetical protein
VICDRNSGMPCMSRAGVALGGWAVWRPLPRNARLTHRGWR